MHNFPQKIIENWHYMKKKQASKVHCNPKMLGFWTLNCSYTLKTTWIDMKILPQQLDFKGNITQQILLKMNIKEGDSSPWSCYHQMQFGELKLNLWTLIGLQKISISWINLKILPYKLEEKAQSSQQVLLNSNIRCKNYNTLNWT